MCDAVVIGTLQKWSQGDVILGIVVLDGMEITELAVVGRIITNDVGCLNIDAFALRLCTYKIYLASLHLTNHYLIAKTYEMVVDDVLNDLLYVALTIATSKCVTHTIILEVELIVALKDTLAVDVITVHLVEHVRLTEELGVVDDSSRGDALTL